MVTTIIRINGLKEVRQLLSKLHPSIREEVAEKGMMNIAESLQRRMRYRAPKKSGWLRRSIMVEKDGKNVNVRVNAFYGMAVEEGRSSDFVIPLAYFEQHKRMPDAPGQEFKPVKRWVTLSGKAQPFAAPALTSLRKDIPNMLNKFVDNAIAKAGGKK